MKRTKKIGSIARVPREFIDEAHNKGMSVKEYTKWLKNENDMLKMLINNPKKRKEDKFVI